MRPILFRLAGVDVPSHEVFAALGIAIALFITWHTARRVGRADRPLLFLIAGGLLGAAILARFGLVFSYLQRADDPTLVGFMRFGGRTLLGGLAGGYLGVVLAKRLINYPRATGDIFAAGVAFGMAIGRIGCFLAERPGTATTLPWGVRVPPSAVPLVAQCSACLSGTAMHPSFVYEIVFDVLAAWALFTATRSGRAPAPWMAEGDLLKLFLFAYAAFRFFVEYVRGSPVMAFGLSGSQVVALLSAIALASYFIRRLRRYRITHAAAPA